MRRVYSPIKTEIIFEVNHTLCAIEFAIVEIRICIQRVSAVYIPKRHCTVNTLVSTDVYKFEQVARSIDPCRQCQYVAVCQGCSHVICEHNSVGIIATGSSPNSRDVNASSPSFSRPAARAPRRACSQAH